jgi:hypothetical protein
MQSIEWNGNNDALTPANASQMTFEIVAEDADGEPVDVTTYVRGTVEELRFDQGYPMLVVGGAEITLDQILRVFDAEDEVPPAAPLDADASDATAASASATAATFDYPGVPSQL